MNLDEVLPAQPPSKAMPVMQISTGANSSSHRPMSAPPGSRNGRSSSAFVGGGAGAGGRPIRESQSRIQTPQRSPERPASRAPRTTAASTLALGPKPELDQHRIDTALALNPGASSRIIFSFLNIGMTDWIRTSTPFII